LLAIGVFVFWMRVETICLSMSETSPNSKSFTHLSILDFVCTILPGLVLLTLATPSFALLYSSDESIDSSLIVQVI
jgi:heme/copper-type cytochrome/quinol oxidase subunit 2